VAPGILPEMDRTVSGVYNNMCGSLASYILGGAEKSGSMSELLRNIFFNLNFYSAPSALSNHATSR
jgi:hypothetical protein